MDLGEKIDAQNEMLMDLQRQKVWSYAQNAQLEAEVEALQRQLAAMDESPLYSYQPDTEYKSKVKKTNIQRSQIPMATNKKIQHA